jgi:hypothetical protein
MMRYCSPRRNPAIPARYSGYPWVSACNSLMAMEISIPVKLSPLANKYVCIFYHRNMFREMQCPYEFIRVFSRAKKWNFWYRNVQN